MPAKKRTTFSPESYALAKEIRTSRASIHAKLITTVKKITDEKRSANTEETVSMDAMQASIMDHDTRINAVENVTIDLGDEGDDPEPPANRSQGSPTRTGEPRSCNLQHYGESDVEHATRQRMYDKMTE